MSTFTTPLDLRFLDGKDFALLREFVYHVGAKDSGEEIHVPTWFVTDFASVPRFFWRFVPPVGPYGKAAVIHDYIYRTAGHLGYTRLQADQIFLEAMEVLGVKKWKRRAMYRGVRMGGKKAWQKETSVLLLEPALRMEAAA